MSTLYKISIKTNGILRPRQTQFNYAVSWIAEYFDAGGCAVFVGPKRSKTRIEFGQSRREAKVSQAYRVDGRRDLVNGND